MLAKANRIVRGADYQAVVRRGARIRGGYTLTYVAPNGGGVVRFGFIVGKTVGGAVVRNRVRRRLKAAAHQLLPQVPAGHDVVVRAFPACAQAPWSTLLEELTHAVHRAGSR